MTAAPTWLMVVTVLCGAGFVVVWWTLRSDRGESARGGWAKAHDLRALTVRHPTPGRVSLGTCGRRQLALEPRSSLLVLGASQSWKTTRVCVPALKEWPGPAIVTSVKDDLVMLTSGYRPGPVWTFNPTNPASARWTPLAGCEDWQEALRVAHRLVAAGEPPRGDGRQDAFWYANAQTMIAPLLYAAASAGKTMYDVARWVYLFPDKTVVDEVNGILVGMGDEDPVIAWSATVHRDERLMSSIKTTAETVLAVFTDPTVAIVTSKCEFTPRQLIASGGTVYLRAPADEQTRLRPLFSTLLAACFAYMFAHGPIDPPLLCVLDELANIAPIENLDQIASTCAGLGVQLVSVFQDQAQITARYRERADTIINNHNALLVLAGGKDLKTLRATSDLIGEHTETRLSHTVQSGVRRSLTVGTEHRRLAPVADLRTMRRGTGVLLAGSCPPVRLRLGGG